MRNLMTIIIGLILTLGAASNAKAYQSSVKVNSEVGSNQLCQSTSIERVGALSFSVCPGASTEVSYELAWEPFENEVTCSPADILAVTFNGPQTSLRVGEITKIELRNFVNPAAGSYLANVGLHIYTGNCTVRVNMYDANNKLFGSSYISRKGPLGYESMPMWSFKY